MEIRCKNCGELNIDTKFCINCGNKLIKESYNEFYNEVNHQTTITSDFDCKNYTSHTGYKEEIYPQTYEQTVHNYGSHILGPDEKFCIVCGQPVKISSISCKYCKATVEPTAKRNKMLWNQQSPISIIENPKGLGIQSLIFGVIGLFCCNLFGIAAVIQGFRATKYEKEKGLGTAGLILGIIDIIIWILVFFMKYY
ncbi:MAG: Double zinc ribbon [bacterium ADurb.Bin363]|nr:MAG: Double zinc ribbon [bacterium ADurb.Bin363]